MFRASVMNVCEFIISSRETSSTNTSEGKWSSVNPSFSLFLSLFLDSLAPPSALVRPKPYQGVRVRDPVKELLKRKRSLEPHSTKTAPPTAVRAPWPWHETSVETTTAFYQALWMSFCFHKFREFMVVLWHFQIKSLSKVQTLIQHFPLDFYHSIISHKTNKHRI